MAYRKSELPPFSKIAYRNLGNDKIIVNRLNRELEQWAKSKRGIDDLAERIRMVTGMSDAQARRVARTERTRVQGNARLEAIRELNQSRPKGQKAWRKEWVARNDKRTRDSHATMTGQVQYNDQYFTSGAGNKLMYPGDPNAPAGEVCNCRCYMRRISASEVEKLNECKN